MQCKHKANADINIAIFISKINMESCLLGMDMDVGVSVLKVLTFKSVRITYGSSRYINNLVVIKGHYMCFLVT